MTKRRFLAGFDSFWVKSFDEKSSSIFMTSSALSSTAKKHEFDIFSLDFNLIADDYFFSVTIIKNKKKIKFSLPIKIVMVARPAFFLASYWPASYIKHAHVNLFTEKKN